MICVIPARAGSTRIPLKNIKEFHGKPIIEYSIETAEKSGLFDTIIVSTDGEDVVETVNHTVAWVIKRGEALSTNDVGTQEVVKDCLLDYSEYSFDVGDPNIVCCLYATSPLLTVEDLAKGLALLKSNPNMQYAFSVGTEPLRDAGNFYWGRREAFLADIPVHAEHSIMVPLPEERVCDINTPEDWAEAEEKYRKLYGSEI